MKKITWILGFITALLLINFQTSFAETPPVTPNGKVTPSLTNMLKKVMPTIVNIYVQGQMPPGRYPMPGPGPQGQPSPYGQMAPKFQDIGSGVIIDAKNGYIVTNAHVVRYGQTIVVTLNDGRRFRGKLIGLDNPSDIAVIKINANNISSINFADSDKVQVGDYVAAIGSPFGLLTQSVTSGVVSALNRSDLGIEGIENFIQTDAPINPGNSGGALVNMNGELVGINTAIIGPSGGNVGIGFAIPSNMAKSVMNQLIQYGKVERGILGVTVQDLTPDLADALNVPGNKGALITAVFPGSPAAKAGLQVKDIVVDINGETINTGAQLRNMVGLTRVGTPLKLTVLRDNKKIIIEAKSLPRPQAIADETQSSFLAGVQLRNYDQLNDNTQEIKGVQIIGLDDDSSAALKGLIPGDVILEANGQPVTTIPQLIAAANTNSTRLLLEIQRGDGRIFAVVDNN